MSLFWWNRFPQNWHGYGLVSECISRCVDNVLERLNAFPHCLHSNTFSTLWTALEREIDGLRRNTYLENQSSDNTHKRNVMKIDCYYLCWLKLISWPKVLLHNSQAYGRLPLCDLLACTSNPCGVENIFSHLIHE